MDFSQHYFAAPQNFGFIIPPLTPSHSNSAGSDDFNTTSPPEVFDGFGPNEQFHNFDGYAQFNPQAAAVAAAAAAAHAFPGPPTPPNAANPSQAQQQQQPPQPQGQAQAQQQNGVPASSLQQQQQQQQQPQGAAASSDLDFLGQDQAGDDPNQTRRGGSNSDEDELTPAQSRRKAQNRAAQRAFRERKERHVKDLEAKLATLEAAQHQTATENERLKRDIQKISTENEILRATSSLPGGGGGGGNGASGRSSMSPGSSGPTTTGPQQYNPTDFYTNVLSGHQNKTLSHRIVTSEDGERLYAAGATWDFIIGHDLFRRGLVDLGDLSDRLKSRAKCDGQGPVFEERVIIEAIEQSVASGSDELL